MKIGVIGNSHLAAFKLGWDILDSKHPDLTLTFFGSPATTMRNFRCEGNELIPTTELLKSNLIWTSGGHDRITGDMDAYIVIGMGFSFVHCISLFKSHRPFGYYNAIDESQSLISESFFHAAMENTLRNSNALMIIEMLKIISSAPILYVPNPFSTKQVLLNGKYPQYNDSKICKRVFEFYNDALVNMLKNVQVYPQPIDTITDQMFTKEKFSRGSIKLKKGLSSVHNEDDFFHMNVDFGVISLSEILLNFK
jgi:hypothetical protein